MTLAPNALTTPKEIRAELGITGNVDRLINAASDRVERYCQRSFFYEAARVDQLPGFADFYLTAEKGPILSVASLKYDGALIDSAEYEIADDWRIRSDSGFTSTAGTARDFVTNYPKQGSEKGLYTLTYSCGYVTPAQAADLGLSRSLPYDIEDAVIQLVAMRYLEIGNNPRVKSERLMSHQVNYGGPSTMDSEDGIPTTIAATLKGYRRLAQA